MNSHQKKCKKTIHQELISLFTDTSPIVNITLSNNPWKNVVTLKNEELSLYEFYKKIILEIDNECIIVDFVKEQENKINLNLLYEDFYTLEF